jgi:hypothetical protein
MCLTLSFTFVDASLNQSLVEVNIVDGNNAELKTTCNTAERSYLSKATAIPYTLFLQQSVAKLDGCGWVCEDVVGARKMPPILQISLRANENWIEFCVSIFDT